MSFAEVGLGVVSMITPLGWIAAACIHRRHWLRLDNHDAFLHNRQTSNCAFGVASLRLTGVGFGAREITEILEKASDAAFVDRGFFKPAIKTALLEAASDLAKNGVLVY
jgi:hypothetical protein